MGFLVGVILSQGLMFLQTQFSLISGSVYKIDRIDISFQSVDFFIIFMASQLACLVAIYPAANKGSQLEVVEGLKMD